jgi:hypothetical protein
LFIEDFYCLYWHWSCSTFCVYELQFINISSWLFQVFARASSLKWMTKQSSFVVPTNGNVTVLRCFVTQYCELSFALMGCLVTCLMKHPEFLAYTSYRSLLDRWALSVTQLTKDNPWHGSVLTCLKCKEDILIIRYADINMVRSFLVDIMHRSKNSNCAAKRCSSEAWVLCC